MKIVKIKIDNVYNNSFFDSNELDLSLDANVIVDTDRGYQFGVVSEIIDKDVVKNEYKKVVRIATKKDITQYNNNLIDAKNAIIKCKNLIKKLELNMSIIDANYNFDKSQFLIRFISDERVDFRTLAKELGSKLKTRIEFRQIGIRDKAKEIGGFGPCGRLLCCSSFLTNFNTVSINMAKNQGLALNPTKINGVCGRLLCCLNYENDGYTLAKKNLPLVGDKIEFNGKEGKVISVEPLKNKYKILINNEIVEVDDNDSKK